MKRQWSKEFLQECNKITTQDAIATKLITVQQNDMQIHYTEFEIRSSRNVEITGRNLLMVKYKKVKFALGKATKAQRRSTGIDLLFL